MSIENENKYFIAKYNTISNAQLFLEDDESSEFILLSTVYVDPVLKGTNLTVNEKLIEWLTPSKSTSKNNAYNTNVMMICGKAGIGKTSLVSSLLASRTLNKDNLTIHAVRLSKKVEGFNPSAPWESVKKAFGSTDDNDYSNTLLILDGFDELCVLSQGYTTKDWHDFLVYLSGDLAVSKAENVKILITSREHDGYYDEVKNTPGKILVETIQWTQKEMKKWCYKYSLARRNHEITDWCRSLKTNYSSFNDELKEVFCTPIILYICCHEKISTDISNANISGIYDKAFKQIVRKAYDGGKLEVETGLSVKDGAVVMWQLIKELAYQMFLNDRLNSGAGTDLIRKAKSRVLGIKSDITSLTEEKLSSILKKLPAVFHFAVENSDGGYEFAHKTVAEYFTAIKIYEDYFAQYNSEYSSENDIKDLWYSIYEGFRYKSIPEDIWKYLNNFNESIYNGEEDQDSEKNKFEFDIFRRIYVKGIKENAFSKFSPDNPTEEYFTENDTIAEQISCAFRNLTWFLTGHDYDNRELSNIHSYMNSITTSKYSDINCNKWQLILTEDDYITAEISKIPDEIKRKNIYDFYFDFRINKSICCPLCLRSTILSDSKFNNSVLTKFNLRNADLNSADLSGAKLISADLSGANLSGADLSSADLISADLIYADLISADLRSADLSSADLSSANLRSANLISADLSSAKLRSADLSSANLRDANLKSADLSDADLRIADLSDADLMTADLSDADLSNADLSNADLSYADLSGIKHNDGTKWKNAKYNSKTKFPEGFDTKAYSMILDDEE